MLTVIGAKGTRTRRVIWMLEELGLDYDHQDHPPRTPEVKRYNASGKVPVLLDGDLAITDSVAILQYLTDKHGRFTYPAGSPERARQDAFTFRILDEIESLLWTAARHGFILPEELRVPSIKLTLRWEFNEAINRLADDLGDGPFLMGEAMTVPDLLLVHCIGWAENAKFEITAPAILAFQERMHARPAAQVAYA